MKLNDCVAEPSIDHTTRHTTHMYTDETAQDRSLDDHRDTIIDFSRPKRFGYGTEPLVGKEPLPTTTGETVPLHAYLPDSGILPDEFEPAYGDHGTLSYRADPVDRSQQVSHLSSRRTYTPNGALPSERDEALGQDVIAAQVSAVGDPTTDAAEALTPDTTQVEFAHKRAVRGEFGGEPTFDAVTDWVETHLEEQEVEGYRRTEIAYWIPILDRHESIEYPRAKPYREWATVIQSTPWGTIGVSAHLEPVDEPHEALTTVSRLADDCFQRVLDTEGTVLTSQEGQERTSDSGEETVGWVPWSEMSDVEHRRVVVGALQTLSGHRGDGVSLGEMMDVLCQRYRAPVDEVRAVVEDLVDNGRLTESPTKFELDSQQ